MSVGVRNSTRSCTYDDDNPRWSGEKEDKEEVTKDDSSKKILMEGVDPNIAEDRHECPNCRTIFKFHLEDDTYTQEEERQDSWSAPGDRIGYRLENTTTIYLVKYVDCPKCEKEIQVDKEEK